MKNCIGIYIKLFLIVIIPIEKEISAQSIKSKDKKELHHLKTVLWPKAFREQDTVLLDQILHTTYQSIDASGNRSTKQDEINYVKNNKSDNSDFRFIVERFDIYNGGFAIIDGTGIFPGESEKINYKSSNYFIKENDRWQVIASHISGIEKIKEYFGLKPPGFVPEIFAPGIISGSQPEHGYVAISPTGKMIFWSRMSSDFRKGALWFSEWKNNNWTKPQIVDFSNEESRDLCPVLSWDAKTMYFTSMRPVNGKKGYNLWSTKKEKGEWNKPIPLSDIINHGRESGCTITPDGSLYYMAWKEGDFKSCDIYISKFQNDKYESPQLMDRSINSDSIETTPFISPDGSYLLFSSQRGKVGNGGFDLYVSFKDKSGEWIESQNLGSKINSETNEWFPSVSPDGKYIFFVSGKSGNDDVYWVDAQILDEFKIQAYFENSIKNVPKCTGKYLGQKLPGSEPRLFASKHVSSIFMEHSPVVFSTDGKELYWSPDFRDFDLNGASIFTMKQGNNTWSDPVLAEFSQPFCDYNPVLSSDNTMMLFTSNRAYSSLKPESRDLDIWMSKRTDSDWSDPVKIEIEDRPGYLMTQFSLTQNNVLYFSSSEDLEKYSWDIYRAELNGDKFVNSKKLSSIINTNQWETFPFIAPDESYLIFTSMNRQDSFGSMDLYISFRNDQGEWSTPQNMGKSINTKHIEAFAGLSPDGKYLFFTSNRDGNVDMYWVNSRIIDALRMK